MQDIVESLGESFNFPLWHHKTAVRRHHGDSREDHCSYFAASFASISSMAKSRFSKTCDDIAACQESLILSNGWIFLQGTSVRITLSTDARLRLAPLSSASWKADVFVLYEIGLHEPTTSESFAKSSWLMGEFANITICLRRLHPNWEFPVLCKWQQWISSTLVEFWHVESSPILCRISCCGLAAIVRLPSDEHEECSFHPAICPSFDRSSLSEHGPFFPKCYP